MKVSDLKFGDIVTTRNNQRWIVVNEYLENKQGNYLTFDLIDENLKKTGCCGHGWDIMKVERYELFKGIQTEKLYTLTTIYERKKEILDEKEKEYLRVALKQKDNILWIKKNKSYDFLDKEYISILYDDDVVAGNVVSFPYFKKGTMYKGMKVGKKYSIKELGL